MINDILNDWYRAEMASIHQNFEDEMDAILAKFHAEMDRIMKEFRDGRL